MIEVEKSISIDIFLDECGGINTKFFTIGGILIIKKNNLHKIKRNFKKVNKNIKIKLSAPIKSELKACKTNLEEKNFIFDNLKNFHHIFISITCQNEKYKIKSTNRNLAIMYNYLIKILVSHIFKKIYKQIKNYSIWSVNIHCDNRNISTVRLKSLEDYLNSEFIFYDENIDLVFNVKYLDSKSSWSIQYADLIANTKYLIINEKFDNKKVQYSVRDIEKLIKMKFNNIDYIF